MLLNLTHTALRIKGELDDGKLVHLIATLGNRLTQVLWGTGEGQSLGETEGGLGEDLAGGTTGALDGGLTGGLRLVHGGSYNYLVRWMDRGWEGCTVAHDGKVVTRAPVGRS